MEIEKILLGQSSEKAYYVYPENSMPDSVSDRSGILCREIFAFALPGVVFRRAVCARLGGRIHTADAVSLPSGQVHGGSGSAGFAGRRHWLRAH